MSDESKPQIQQTQSQSAVKKDDKKTPSAGDSAGGRGVKKAPPIAKTNSASPAASAPQNAASSGGGNGGGSNSGASRNTRQPKRTSNATPTGPQARVAADDISRPSSTDGSKRGDNKRRGGGGGNRGNGNGGVQKKTQTNAPTGTRSGGSNAKGANAPASNVSAPESTDSDALSSLQRVITDLKSISPPSTSPSTGNLSSSRSGDFHMPTSASQPFPQPSAGNASSPPQGSNLPVNAPVFQPGAGAYPPQGATELPRHRKSASTGSHGNPNAGSFNNPHFPSALGGFSSQLGSMQEDAEDSLMGGGDFDEGDIPGDGSYPQALNFPRGQAQAHVPMGSFTAPRFAALAAQQQQQQQGQRDDSVGPTGRPQLAPGFMFGARRRGSASNPAPAIAEEDAGFQFPQQQQGFQAESGLGGNVHRRGQSEVPVTGLLAEQMALQSQIEALQQQQQQLLQQQIASGNMAASFSAPQLQGMGRAQVHRRIQSQQVPIGMQGNFFGGAFGGMPGGNVGVGLGAMGLGMQNEQQGVPRGHGRRHSVNVVNKSAQDQGAGGGYNQYDGFDDGFVPPQIGHSRNVSRADSSWRINGGANAIQNAGMTSDLAQAQAQLQSLQQFRAAAGGHHQKMPSFSFPNMLPNVMAANMMGLGGFNLLQQQQQFQMQLQQQSQQPQRKSLFAPYLPQASLPPLLAAGKLVVGILRVNKRNRSDAYISTEVLDADIYICGSKDRNRALEGDIVAVELLDVDEVWGTKKEKEEKKRKKEENAAYDLRSAIGRKNDKKKDDVEVEGQGLMLFEDEEVTDEVKPQYAGHVVAVVERMPGQLFSGTLGLLRPSSAATKEKQEAERREREGDRGEDDHRQKPNERPKIVWFKPTDKRVPLIAIPTEQAPPDFVQNPEAYADRLFVACIKRHPISSLHPFGTLVEELGPIGDPEVETSALLKDCNFPTEDFNENVLKCIPPLPWTIPEREIEARRDLRNERIFTIDPETAKDLDDAVSIQVNEDGTYDVGVHIADVSYFVKPNTALDRDARKRATSVYLVQRAVPMLPPLLSEELCSLIPGQDKLTFSVIFTMTPDARVLKKWFGRTIINSAAKLSYSHTQNVIEGRPIGNVEVTSDHKVADIEHDIQLLGRVAKQLRARRFETGTLHISSTRLVFELGENGAPTDCSAYEQKDANSLIEEFMLLANISTAHQVALHFPEQALLRRHEDPMERRLVAFAQRAERMGVNMDVSSGGAIQKSFDAIEDPHVRRLLEILSTKAMHSAKYFCAGMLDIAKYHHYALNVPLYTHFTSPIRRYADILVHRQLESVLAGGTEPKFTMDRDSVAKIAQQCNIKKESAKLAQEQSAHLFLCLLIADLTQRYGPVIRQAKVVGVLDAAFDVLVPEFGIEKRVHVDQMPIENHVYDEHSHTLQIYWTDRDVINWLSENSDDEHLKKVKQTVEQHAAKMEVASRSLQDESALFDEDEADEEDEVILKRTETTEDATEKKQEKEETSKQRLLSKAHLAPEFEGLRTTGSGHRIQDIRELMSVPVIVTADLTKSPPVIKVYSVNPYAEQKK